jgi:hypothetical protein
MQTDPPARHSTIGLFQRDCYLAYVVSDGRVAAARREGKLAHQPGSSGAGRAPCDPAGLPCSTEPPGLAAQPLPDRPR